MDEIKLKADLEKLNSLSKQLLSYLVEREVEERAETNIQHENKFDFNAHAQEYKELRAEVLLEITADFKIPVIEDEELREQLKIFFKDGDNLTSFLKKKKAKNFREFGKKWDTILQPEFPDDRLRQLESDLFYSWFSPSDYIYRLIGTAPIVIKNIEFPDKLQKLIIELRECLIFEQYLAAGIMLRTIAEVAVKDIQEKNFTKKRFKYHHERLTYLMTKSNFCIPAFALENLREELNNYVHGNKLPDGKIIKKYYVENILNQIQEMYEMSEFGMEI